MFRRILRRLRERYEDHPGLAGASWVTHGFLRHKEWEAEDAAQALPAAPRDTQGADPSNPLETYFDSHTTGRGIWKWRHYFDIYHRHFSKFIGQEVHLLEVGVYSGGSLDMWKQYFGPRCKIYGVDIEEACKSYEDDSVRIFVGDQADRNFWKQFKKEVPRLDIVIDDGGHLAHQQIATLEETLPHLQPGGVYLCEDVHGTSNRFGAYISGLSYNLNGGIWKEESGEYTVIPNQLQSIVRSVHLYPFVVVIEKADNPVRELAAPKHGTHWQPFWWSDHGTKKPT